MITFSTDSPFCMNHGLGVFLFPLIVEKKDLPNKLYLDWNEPNEKERAKTTPFQGKEATRSFGVDEERYRVYFNAPKKHCIPWTIIKAAEENGYKLVSDNATILSHTEDKCTGYTGKLRWENKLTEVLPNKEKNGVKQKMIEVWSPDGETFLGNFLVITVEGGPRVVLDNWSQTGYNDMIDYVYNDGPYPSTTAPDP